LQSRASATKPAANAAGAARSHSKADHGFARRRAARRAAARARSKARVVVDLTPAQRAVPALSLPTSPRGRRVGRAVVVLLVGVALHALVLLIGIASGRLVDQQPRRQQVTVELAPPPPPPPPPEPEPEPPVVEAVAEPAPEPPPPKPKKRPPKKAPPPPPPETKPEPPPPPAAKPPPRIVGLSLDSTAAQGDGPAFAVGNTRAGSTGERAADAKKVPKVGQGDIVEQVPEGPMAVNRTATRIPTVGVTLTKPKIKKRPDPQYPPTLKAQGIETDVLVSVVVGLDGKPKTVRLLKKAPYEEFNDSARKAASAYEFEPARKGGKVIEYTLSFTIRFRLEE